MDLVFLHGPAASGKLTTGRALASITGFALFHNHLVVDTLLAVFPFGSAPFVRLRDEFWMSTFAEAVASGRSLIFTFTPEPTVPVDFPERARRAVEERGGRVHFVSLTVSPGEQEARIGNLDRREYRKLADVYVLREIRGTAAADRAGDRGPLPADLTIETDRSPADDSARTIAATLRLEPQHPHEAYPSGT